MKVDLSPDLRSRLASVRDPVSAVIEALKFEASMLANIQELITTQQAEITRLESALDVTDESAVAALTAKQNHLAMLTKKAERIENSGAVQRRLRDALRPCPDLIRESLLGPYERLVERVTDALAPFYSERGRAKNGAMATDCVNGAYHLLKCEWAIFPPSQALAEQVLGFLDQLLAGDVSDLFGAGG